MNFANVYRLQRHMISHDESAGLRKFKCTYCGKPFSHSGSYSSHMTSKKCLILNSKNSRPRLTSLDKGVRSSSPARRNGSPSPTSNNKLTNTSTSTSTNSTSTSTSYSSSAPIVNRHVYPS